MSTLEQKQKAPEKTRKQQLEEWRMTPAGQAAEARHLLAAQRLKERLSSVPFHAERAKKDGDAYWRRLAASNPNA